MDKLLSYQKKEKITIFFSIVQGSAREKTYKLLAICGFTLKESIFFWRKSLLLEKN